MDPFSIVMTVIYISLTIAIHAVVFIHILLNKHEEPASAVLWLVVVVVFPFVGIIFYLMFGVNRLKTTGVSIQLANDMVDEETGEMLRKGLLRHLEVQKDFVCRHAHEESGARYIDSSFTLDRILPEQLPLHGNRVKLLRDGTMAYPLMLKAIENAKSTINLQSFIIVGDDVGKKIFDTLVAKAEDGVVVRILYDQFGSAPSVWKGFFRKYAKRSPNMTVLPFTRGNLLAPWRVQLRNHRKLLVIDGKIAYIGGINISSENVKKKVAMKDKYIHDLHCEVHGPAVGEMQFSFLRDWCYATKLSPAKVFDEAYFPPLKEEGKSVIRVVDTGPGQRPEASEKVFYTAAATAKRYIWIMTPYFVPDKAFLRALTMAAARGVEVKLIVPLNNNHWYVDFATHSLYENMMESGIHIYEKSGVFSHVKAMVVDGEWGMMGSSNCDVRSFKLNYELDMVISCGDFVDKLHDQFVKELEDSGEVPMRRIVNKKLGRKLAENLCSLLTPIL